MGTSGLENGSLPEENKTALQSGTCGTVGKVMKTEPVHFTDAPEIQHFAVEKFDKNENAYGIAWGEVVREYLLTAYGKVGSKAEIASGGRTYKVLDRGEVTAFYDADGNTLFDVENKRLKKDYGWLVKGSEGNIAEDAETHPEAPKTAENNENDAQDARSVKQQAEGKLKKEMAKASNKTFAEPVIRYLIERCKEDGGLSEDVMQRNKTWKKCFDYIYSKARKQAQGNCAAIRDEVVYEWAEDYYHMDDKAEEEKKAKKAAKAKPRNGKSVAERKTDRGEGGDGQAEKVPSQPKAEVPKEQPKPKKNNKDMDGQLDMFSLMGM